MVLQVRFAETMQRLDAKFDEIEKVLPVEFDENIQCFEALFSEVQHVTEYVGGEIYEGNYTVIPKAEDQSLPTRKKVMVQNLTVAEIPFFDVSNTSGGTTIYIGG